MTLLLELMEVNQKAGIEPVEVHPDLFFTDCSRKPDIVKRKGSHLNIAIGPLVQTWRIGFSDARKPDQGKLNKP